MNQKPGMCRTAKDLWTALAAMGCSCVFSLVTLWFLFKEPVLMGNAMACVGMLVGALFFIVELRDRCSIHKAGGMLMFASLCLLLILCGR